MCILPNFEGRDLAVLKQNRKKGKITRVTSPFLWGYDQHTSPTESSLVCF